MWGTCFWHKQTVTVTGEKGTQINMRILAAKDYNHMSRQAANLISAQVILEPASVLGLATGSTPVGTYKQLIEWYKFKLI